MVLKLSRKDQRDLNERGRKLKGIKLAINMLSEQLGEADIELWSLVKKLSKGQRVVRVDYNGTNAKLITDKEKITTE